MPSTISISQLNRQITIKKYVFAQNDSGGNIKLLVLSYNLFASVEPISNTYILEQLQLKYGEGYKIVIRYEPDRLLTPNDEITYNGYIHKIKGIRYDNEAQKRFVILNTSIGNTQSNTGEGSIYIPLNEYHYTATGGESYFQDDILKNWSGIILVFRDGVDYRVITTGTPTKKQALYNSTDGSFTFSTDIIPLSTGETIDVYKIDK